MCVGQVGEDRRRVWLVSRGKLNGEVAGHADILAQKSARISVSVPWNSSLIMPLNAAAAACSITPPLPLIDSRRAAAADHKHPVRRRRQNSVDLGL